MRRVAGSENSAIVAVLAAVLLFSLIELIIKRLVAIYPLHQVVFLRVASSLPLMVLAFWHPHRRLGLTKTLRLLVTTRRPGLHALRCLLSAVAMTCIFYAVASIPLGTAAALTSTTPLLLLAASPILLGESVSAGRWMGVLLGFAGVCLMTGPQPTTAWLGIGSALLGATATAGVVVCLRLLANHESAAHTALLNAAGMGLIGLAAIALLGWVPLQPGHWLESIVLGFLGAAGHLVITWAYRHAHAGVLAPLGFTATLWAALFGYLLWGETPSVWTAMGMLAIIAGGVWSTRR
jgi:drug/metabolite transporter (DMT)-like permease